jgi:uncharacterized protein (TIGR00295 family)
MKSKEAFSLLKKYCASDSVIAHVKKVRDYAMVIAACCECDRELVEAGAILHDIGRSRTHGIDHAVVGAEILRSEGVDERIVRIVERHVGAGLTKEDATNLGLPPKDYIPETIEEKIVCHADNLIGNKERISIHDAIRTAKEKWSPDALQRLVQMHFEVFCPETVRVDRSFCDPEVLDKSIGTMDVLFKHCPADEKCEVAVYGHEARKATEKLKRLNNKRQHQ